MRNGEKEMDSRRIQDLLMDWIWEAGERWCQMVTSTKVSSLKELCE